MKRQPGVTGHRLLFGLAMVQGAAAVLGWGGAGFAGPGGAPWHAHEMIFGQALAVVGGYLLSRAGAPMLMALATIWTAARLAVILLAIPDEVRAALSVSATAGIALPAASTFLRGAKRAGNLVFPLVVGGFVLADVLFQLGELDVWPAGTQVGLRTGLGLTMLLIAAMGGRLIGAAASGAAQRAGGARIPPQHGLERALLALLVAGFAAEAFAVPRPAGPVLLALAGTLLGVRVALWAPGLRRGGGDLLALAAGQVWLALGLLGWSAAAAGLPMPELAMLHLATIGGIGGTLLVMMMRSAAQREGRPMPRRTAPLVAGLMGAAALVRAFGPPGLGWAVAAALWAAATLVAAGAVFGGGRR